MKNKIANISVIVCFLAFIYALFFICLFKPADELSFAERRKLAQFPKFNVKTVLNAEFMKGFDDYSVDQIAFRNDWRRLKAVFDLNVFMKNDNNSIFVSSGMVFKTEYPINESSVRRLCNIMNYCDEKFLEGLNVYYTVVPDKNFYLRNTGHLILDYEKMAEMIHTNLRRNMQYIDLFGSLELDCYYMTDSHWKQEKLGGVLVALSDGFGIEMFIETKNYEKKTFSPFYGVYYGQSALNVTPDVITYFTNDIIENAVVTSLEKPGQTFKVYDETALGGMDSYNLFMLGPAAVINITNPENTSGRGLIIFRDSYAASLAPLLIEFYSNITLIDLRYIRPDLLGNPEIAGDYVDFNGKDILFMLSSTLFNNSGSVKNAPEEAFVSPFSARSRVQ